MSQRAQQLIWIVAAAFAVAAVDQITKFIIIRAIPYGSVTFEGREAVFFFFTHERNTGLMGGMLHHKPLLVMIAPLAAIAVLAYLFRHLNAGSRVQSLAYGFVAGGAIGNLIDRFFRGSVVDFLQFHFYFIPFEFPWKRYPAFNVADSAICTGVFLLIVTWYWLDRPHVSRTV
ncbi:MAG TPA: signal peptidase II [Candidatus Hydrogenedentes bacterium]|nr:signal peptidase II [Candidatus Hydrogenedentota bacterium]HOS03245.1 signal peptidase II [Candidatus Hydrogenedentota bacterium]